MPIPPTQLSEDETRLARKLPITDITLNIPIEESNMSEKYQFHNGLSSASFHSMCKNFSGVKSTTFTFLMYKSGRISCTTQGTFSGAEFENGTGTKEEEEHERKYKKYIEKILQEEENSDSENDNEIDELLSFPFFTGTFSGKLLKNVQKMSGYNCSVHIYADPIDNSKEIPRKPLCIKCSAPDSFTIEVYTKSNEQIAYENRKD